MPLDARPSISFDRGMKDVTGRDTFTSVDVYSGGTKIGELHVRLRTARGRAREMAEGRRHRTGLPVEDLYGTWMAVEDGERRAGVHAACSCGRSRRSRSRARRPAPIATRFLPTTQPGRA